MAQPVVVVLVVGVLWLLYRKFGITGLLFFGTNRAKNLPGASGGLSGILSAAAAARRGGGGAYGRRTVGFRN